jgi:hypothetical protein
MLQGYARANEWQELERIERLTRLTSTEARIIFQELDASWQTAAASEQGLDRLDLWRVETLVAVRQAFAQLARAKGLI